MALKQLSQTYGTNFMYASNDNMSLVAQKYPILYAELSVVSASDHSSLYFHVYMSFVSFPYRRITATKQPCCGTPMVA